MRVEVDVEWEETTTKSKTIVIEVEEDMLECPEDTEGLKNEYRVGEITDEIILSLSPSIYFDSIQICSAIKTDKPLTKIK